jgi:hypothetical protein
MEFIDIPSEQTTAATNVLIALFMLGFIWYFRRIGGKERWKANIWVAAAGLQCVAAILGVIVHGFKMSKELQLLLWQPLYFSLGLLVAFFAVAVIYDVWGQTTAQRMLPVMMVVGIAFFGITLIWPDSFRVFIIYEAIAMLFALGGYIWLAFQKRLKGVWWMVGGILTSIIAAGIQASKAISFTFIWSFDHNGAFHLIQILGFIFLTVGLHKAFLARD